LNRAQQISGERNGSGSLDKGNTPGSPSGPELREVIFSRFEMAFKSHGTETLREKRQYRNGYRVRDYWDSLKLTVNRLPRVAAWTADGVEKQCLCIRQRNIQSFQPIQILGTAVMLTVRMKQLVVETPCFGKFGVSGRLSLYSKAPDDDNFDNHPEYRAPPEKV
jgi:hypothetical protein